MIKDILSYISDTISEKINSTRPVTGGSISSAYLLETPERNYFLKLNKAPDALEMFHAEQKGLDVIEKTATISVQSQFTGVPGVMVPIAETIKGFKMILNGELDEYPEMAFLNVGTIDEAIAKGKALLEQSSQ